MTRLEKFLVGALVISDVSLGAVCVTQQVQINSANESQQALTRRLQEDEEYQRMIGAITVFDHSQIKPFIDAKKMKDCVSAEAKNNPGYYKADISKCDTGESGS